VIACKFLKPDGGSVFTNFRWTLRTGPAAARAADDR
jgi:hypothetical protein